MASHQHLPRSEKSHPLNWETREEQPPAIREVRPQTFPPETPLWFPSGVA